MIQKKKKKKILFLRFVSKFSHSILHLVRNTVTKSYQPKVVKHKNSSI